MLSFRAFNIKCLLLGSLSLHKMKRDGQKCPNLNEARVSAGVTQSPGLAYRGPAMLAASFALSLVSFIYTGGNRDCPMPCHNLLQKRRRLVPQIIKLHGSVQKLCSLVPMFHWAFSVKLCAVKKSPTLVALFPCIRKPHQQSPLIMSHIIFIIGATFLPSESC